LSKISISSGSVAERVETWSGKSSSWFFWAVWVMVMAVLLR
jgi:hypothetical protein